MISVDTQTLKPLRPLTLSDANVILGGNWPFLLATAQRLQLCGGATEERHKELRLRKGDEGRQKKKKTGENEDV